MKSINRRALVALAFGMLTFGTGVSFADEPSCCKKGASCCPSDCCKRGEQKVRNDTAERFRAKYGREYPGVGAARAPHADDCCSKSCC
jgi:hypothetical protein